MENTAKYFTYDTNKDKIKCHLTEPIRNVISRV